MGSNSYMCGCIGPQRGEPLCPCMMRGRNVVQRDGRWIEPEKDLGPVRPYDKLDWRKMQNESFKYP